MPEGEVVYWDDTGGYGFIETPATDVDVFVHDADAGVDLAKGVEVAFEVVDGSKGPRADVIRRLDGGPSGGTTTGDTNVYHGSDGDAAVTDPPGGDTQVYGDDTPWTSDDGPAYCFSCGADLGPYPDPDFCPDCGTDLDP
jgi:CspA family cold shock protein